MTVQSRRAFIIGSALGMSSSWLSANWLTLVDGRADLRFDTGNPGPEFLFFSKEQAIEVEAVTAQIIPSDGTPGASEANCVRFIDRALASFLADNKQVYEHGIEELQTKTEELFPSAKTFSSLNADQQIRVLESIENTHFFTTIRNHTVIAMFANPIHGGNQDQVGWKLIGFDNKLDFRPPFGYYDAIVETK
jgi:gluconate 2-dehydrogenase gamma chain